MNVVLLDWFIMATMLVIIISGVVISKRYMTSVADFLSAGRTAGRYLVSVSGGIASLGAITIVAQFEMFYTSGFVMNWWNMTQHFLLILVAVTGWVIYRYRETRALTLAQFFEIRYNRNFRVFTGFIAFFAGLLNFGIFPGVGARFFMYFLGLPPYFSILGIEISTFATIMFVLLFISIYFVFSGGQVAVLVTDFVQGIFISIVFVFLSLYFLNIFGYDQIFEALQTAPQDASLINPFKTSKVKDFNFWYYFLGIVGFIFGQLTWQGASGVTSSAKNAHEQKMGNVLGYWRLMPQILFLLLIPICAYTVLHHADFSNQGFEVQSVLKTLDTPMEKSQLRVPLILTHFLPIGFMGAFAAVMLAAFISTHDTYLHSWATIFIQDVYLPLRKKKLSPQQHLRLLRIAIVGVAIFVFTFSLLFRQSQFILLFFAITASIFAAGAGPVIVFGLYWKRGTTAGAWGAMITGAIISVTGIIVRQMNPDFFINEMWFGFIANMTAAAVYIAISLLGKTQIFNLKKMLHRGKYDTKGDHRIVNQDQSRGWRILAIGKEFTLGDKIIYIGSYLWITVWLIVFIAGTIYYFFYGIPDEGWMKFWYIYLIIYTIISVVVIIWFASGGIRDLKNMFHRLRTMDKDAADNGSVVHEADDLIYQNEH
jgi:SSS family solute:Na+ symporter